MNPIDQLKAAVRDVPDFPKPGILFKDITPILGDAALLGQTVRLFADACKPLGITRVVGIEARGFIFGAAVAEALGAGFVPIRKKGKLPAKTLGRSYALEYGMAEIEVHQDAFHPGERVALIDDLLATGGTARAAADLIAEAGATVTEIQFLIELEFLKGRDALDGYPVRSFIRY